MKAMRSQQSTLRFGHLLDYRCAPALAATLAAGKILSRLTVAPLPVHVRLLSDRPTDFFDLFFEPVASASSESWKMSLTYVWFVAVLLALFGPVTAVIASAVFVVSALLCCQLMKPVSSYRSELLTHRRDAVLGMIDRDADDRENDLNYIHLIVNGKVITNVQTTVGRCTCGVAWHTQVVREDSESDQEREGEISTRISEDNNAHSLCDKCGLTKTGAEELKDIQTGASTQIHFQVTRQVVQDLESLTSFTTPKLPEDVELAFARCHQPSAVALFYRSALLFLPVTML